MLFTIPFVPVSGAGEVEKRRELKVMRRRILALVLAVAALSSTVASASAQEAPARVLVYAGSCQLKITFHFDERLAVGSLGNPGYWLEVRPAGPVMPCQISDDPIDPLRNTAVTASGNSTLFDCDTALAAGGWSQSWTTSDGVGSPAPVPTGMHRVYGTWDNWIMETEGAPFTRFAGVIHLTLDPTWAGQTAAACSNGSLWELHMIGVQVFQDPEV